MSSPPLSPPAAPGALHYAANANFDGAGHYLLGGLGFNLADVSSRWLLDHLPAGVRGLVYLGSCLPDGPAFENSVAEYAGSSALYGFYLADEPEPSSCPPASLLSEAAYLHRAFPHAITFVVLQSTASSQAPAFTAGYTPANTGVDLFGIDPDPCRTEIHGCDFAMVGRYAAAALRAGIPVSKLIPVFQAFGGGNYPDDGGGYWALPTASQAQQLLATWAGVLPEPHFDFVYSWGSQQGDTGLSQASGALQDVFAEHNRCPGPTTAVVGGAGPTRLAS